MDKSEPTPYSDQTAQDICDLTASTNLSLQNICNQLGVKYSTVLSWKMTRADFLLLYARAKQDQADHLAEEIITIADDSSNDLDRVDEYGNRIENREFVNRSKLRVDARKWVAAHLKPKVYGDRLELDGQVQMPVDDVRIAAIAAKINANAANSNPE